MLVVGLYIYGNAWTADREFTVRGMVLRVDPASRSFVVSHEKIVGLMDSIMVRP